MLEFRQPRNKMVVVRGLLMGRDWVQIDQRIYRRNKFKWSIGDCGDYSSYVLENY